MKTAIGRRHFTYLRGQVAERAALVWLVLHGWRPLARRYSAAGGEIDLIMRRGRVIAFVEVKARATMAEAGVAIDGRKRRLFGRAARAWIARHPWSMAMTLRADAVFLAPGAWPQHLANAFELGSA